MPAIETRLRKCYPARPHAPTHSRPCPPDGVRGGKDASCVGSGYMYICDLGHPVADAVSAPVAGSDPTPRSASLRFGVGSLNPGSIHGRRRRLGGSPLRCPREGRCGAGAPVARGSSQVLGSPAERLSSGRRVEARSAALRSVNTPAPRASLRPRAAMAAVSRRFVPGCAPSIARLARTFVPGRGPHMPLRGRVSDSDGLLPRPRTPGGVRP